MANRMFPSYTSKFQDISNIYIKDGMVLKNRGGDVFDVNTEIQNRNNIAVENNKIVDIYCSKEKAELYRQELDSLKSMNSNIEDCIKIHC